MKKLTLIIVVVILATSALFIFNKQPTNDNLIYDKVMAAAKDNLTEMTLSKSETKDFIIDVYDAAKSNDVETLRKLGLEIQTELDNKAVSTTNKQKLFYSAYYYAVSEEGDPSVDSLFLSSKNINDDDIRLSLIDVGVVTSLTQSQLDEIRDKTVKLIRGKSNTQSELDAYTQEIQNKQAEMNNVDAAAIGQVFSLAQDEAVNE